MPGFRLWPPALTAWIWVTFGLALLIAVDVGIAGLLFSVEKSTFSTEPSQSRFHFWLQIFTGNWSAQPVYPFPSFASSLAAATALILNVAPTLAILGFVIRNSQALAYIRKEKAMNLSQALVTKDVITKQKLISLFSDDQQTIDRINEGFRLAENDWRRTLVAVIGRRAADDVFSMLSKEIDPEH